MIGLWRSLTMTGRVAVGIVALIVVTVALWSVLRAVDGHRRAVEAETAQRTATAYGDSARAAIDAVVEAGQRDEQLTREIEDAIEDIQRMPEGDRYAASLGVLCGLPEFAGDPRCASVQHAGSGGVEDGRPRR